MFQPTHWLTSRNRKVPVVVKSLGDRSLIFTEAEWNRTYSPAFELHPKLGIFCRGVQVIGHELVPIEIATPATSTAVQVS